MERGKGRGVKGKAGGFVPYLRKGNRDWWALLASLGVVFLPYLT